MFIFDPIYTALVGSDVGSYSSFPPAIHYTSSIPSLSSVQPSSSLSYWMTTCNRAIFCLLLFHHFSLICIPRYLTSHLLCCTYWLATSRTFPTMFIYHLRLPDDAHCIVSRPPSIVVTRAQGGSLLLDCFLKLRAMGTASVENMMSDSVGYNHKYSSGAPRPSLSY